MKTLLNYRNLVVVLFTVIFALTLHGVSDALTYTHIYVDAVNGVNAPTGRGSVASPYKSITFALLISERNNLPDPWHVHIHPGNYNGDAAKGTAREIFPLKLRQEMIFEGTTTAEECIIDGQHTGDALVPILSGENTEGVTIRNLTIQNSLRTNGVGGTVLHDPTGTKETPSTFEKCIIHNNKGGGVWSNMPLILTGNTFSNNHGAGVWTSKSTAAMDNTFSDNSGSGLHIEGNSTGDISDNIFKNNRESGVHVKDTLKGNVTQNTFSNNKKEGISIEGYTTSEGYIGDITYNTFTGNKWGGFDIRGFTGNVTHNRFEGNYGNGGGGGFRIIGNFTGGNVIHNVFIRNEIVGDGGGGFLITGNFTGNVTHNTFDGNVDLGGGTSHGSGFCVKEILIGEITDNHFTRNIIRISGGAFFIKVLTGKVSRNIFDSNSAKWGGGFELGSATNTVEVVNNIFFNNTSSGTGNAVVTRHATHFMNNLFMISDELSEGVSGMHTIWVNSPECRFHNNIFTGLKTVIYTEGTFDLPITHNLFHNVKVDFVEQAGNNLGNDLLFWELVAVNATDNLEGDPRLVDPVTTRDFHLQSTSPAIDAGTNVFAPADDFDGVIRPVGATVDIGPYEYGGTPIVAIDDPIVLDDLVGEPVDDTPPDPLVPDDSVGEPVDDTPPAAPTLKLYWTTGDKIQRGDLDGSNIEDVINQKAVSIALDAMNDRIYWIHAETGIFRANLDGTNIEHLRQDKIWEISGGRIALDVAGGKMYWSNGITNSIFRANFDGTNAEEVLKLLVGTPLDIALDIASSKIYWTQWQGNASISRANLDGTNVELLINPGDRRGIDLDVVSGKMYWTDGFDGIGMSKLDGSNVTNFDTADFTMGDVILDLHNGRMYWVDGEGFELRRGNLDGSQQQTILKSRISDIALYTPPVASEPPAKTYPAWDVNKDGKTDITDLVMVATALGTNAAENPRLDVNGDGSVNIQDLILVATHLGETTAAAAPVIIELPKHFTPETLQQMLNLLRTQNDGSLAFQRAIANLEQLLLALAPKETALLANYPNPFNPETWIPYQLATPADVTLRIHAVDGTLVRALSLGHKAIGTYQTRSRAAYWDGKNELGEPVASGVYFYTLTASDFNATRKMLIRK
ncbi:MAG: right-handed parallel beta-helix repeat-containing protein [Candidatus Poribacteria bacterium]|nr:right-handed parallel beta-helix repeat-containing protein [Candidatus Poribacteria bacterium]